VESLLHALEPLGIEPKILLAQLAGFLLVWWLLAKFAFKPIGRMLDERAAHITQTMDKLEADERRMAEIRADYEQRIATIEAEARAKISEAVKEGQKLRDELIAEARAKAEEESKKSERNIQLQLEQAKLELRDYIVGLSLRAAGHLLDETLDDTRHKKLVEDFIARA
jgi:F-type H+-transporting ATPase subunit b